MQDFVMSPKIDFCFKELMTNEKVRIGFLSAILKIKPEQIKSTILLNTHLKKEHIEDKQGILDVRLLLDDDIHINIEIQIAPLKIWAERSLFYLAKIYSEHIKKGEDYKDLKKCINISILDFIL